MYTTETLLVLEFTRVPNGIRLKFLDDEERFLPRLSGSNLRLRREWGFVLAQNILKVHEYTAPQALPLSELDGLKGYIYIGTEEESRLRIAKVLNSETLVSLDGAKAHPTKRLSYNSTLGYKDE